MQFDATRFSQIRSSVDSSEQICFLTAHTKICEPIWDHRSFTASIFECCNNFLWSEKYFWTSSSSRVLKFSIKGQFTALQIMQRDRSEEKFSMREENSYQHIKAVAICYNTSYLDECWSTVHLKSDHLIPMCWLKNNWKFSLNWCVY